MDITTATRKKPGVVSRAPGGTVPFRIPAATQHTHKVPDNSYEALRRDLEENPEPVAETLHADLAEPAQQAGTPARINGILLQAEGETVSVTSLQERAYTELLRQEAVRQGLLPDQAVATTPELSDAEREIIETMLEQQVQTPVPTLQEAERYYLAHKRNYVVDQAVNVRHILFAVTPGVNVQVLARKAEEVLLELMDAATPDTRFDQQARSLSNCPSGAQGGHLGWLEPQDCAPELAKLFFFENETEMAQGLHPRLVHSRFGLHIIDVLDRRPGRQLAFDEVQDRIELQLSVQSRATALRQYMLLLVGSAEVEGIELEGSTTPLVQD